MYNKLKFLHRKTQSVFFFKFLMIRLLARHHPAANPSPPFPLCPAAGQREKGGRGWWKLSCRIFFKMASLRLPLAAPMLLIFSSLDGTSSVRLKLCGTAVPRLLIFSSLDGGICVRLKLCCTAAPRLTIFASLDGGSCVRLKLCSTYCCRQTA